MTTGATGATGADGAAGANGIGAERRFDAVVCGRSLPALLVALELAEVGLSVAIIGETAPVPYDSERDPGGEIAALIERIATPIGASMRTAETGEAPPSAGSAAPEGTSTVRRSSGSPQISLRGVDGEWVALPEPAVLGMTAAPLSEGGRRLLGSRGATRAYLDRLKPVLTIGKTRRIGEVVRSRLGREARQRLLEPVVRERFGTAADDVDMAIAVPGMNEALSRAGSLTLALLEYSERYVARETRVAPAGGWASCTADLVARLGAYRVVMIDEVLAAAEETRTDWLVSLRSGQTLHARAIVSDSFTSLERVKPLDGGNAEGPRPAAAWSEVSERRRERVYAEIDIQAPPGAPADVLVCSVGEFSVRAERQSSGGWSARLSGPAAPFSGPERAMNVTEEALNDALQGAGFEAARAAEWRIDSRPAPYATLEQKQGAEEAIGGVIAAHPRVLPVGRHLHGDDLGAALSSAQSGAIALRRSLLGLTE